MASLFGTSREKRSVACGQYVALDAVEDDLLLSRQNEMRIDERLEDIPHTLKQLGHGKLLQQPPDRTHETQGLQAAGQAGQVRGV